MGGGSKARGRVPMPTRPVRERRQDFGEVTRGYTPEMAQAEAARCLQCSDPPCEKGCPVKVKIKDFVREIQKGNFEGAREVILAASNLPAVCGRVCPQEQQCEDGCVLGKKGEPLAIGRLERFVTDYTGPAAWDTHRDDR